MNEEKEQKRKPSIKVHPICTSLHVILLGNHLKTLAASKMLNGFAKWHAQFLFSPIACFFIFIYSFLQSWRINVKYCTWGWKLSLSCFPEGTVGRTDRQKYRHRYEHTQESIIMSEVPEIHNKSTLLFKNCWARVADMSCFLDCSIGITLQINEMHHSGQLTRKQKIIFIFFS